MNPSIEKFEEDVRNFERRCSSIAALAAAADPTQKPEYERIHKDALQGLQGLQDSLAFIKEHEEWKRARGLA